MALDITDIAGKAINLADELDEDTLVKLGKQLIGEIEGDIDSRSEWEARNDKWIELASQVMEKKSTPWPNAANVKFPLLSTAAIQFHARAFPALFGRRDIAKGKIVGADPEGTKKARSRRVGKFMSTQMLDVMPNWVDDMDRLLIILPIVGLAYKKTYYSPSQGKRSDLLSARDVIVNYYARDYNKPKHTQHLSLIHI